MDKTLRRVLVTADFHRLHHSSKQVHTDSNYDGILTGFGYLFGTATKRGFKKQTTMEPGLEYCRDRKDSRLDQLLLPFSGSTASRMPAQQGVAEHT